jgi:hypothetical protein
MLVFKLYLVLQKKPDGVLVLPRPGKYVGLMVWIPDKNNGVYAQNCDCESILLICMLLQYIQIVRRNDY